MPIFSFLAYPKPQMKEQLVQDLSRFEHCDIQVSENEEVLILLTDTPDEETQKKLITAVKAIDALQSLSMAFGHTDL